jgi:hypothetical protein
MAPALKIAFVGHDTAKYACERWHYTRKIPTSKLVRFGVWEYGVFTGVIIFGAGASARLHEQYGLSRYEVCELVRVALADHETPVSRCIAIALRLLKKSNPGLKLCVSFADPSVGHHGGIYQAGNWIFTGESRPQIEVLFRGKWQHVTSSFRNTSREEFRRLSKRRVSGKFRYVMPLDDETRKKVIPLSKPYPKKRASEVKGNGTLAQREEAVRVRPRRSKLSEKKEK